MANEKRLIDASALLARLANSSESWAKNLQAIRNWWPHAVGIKDNIVSLIKEAPTVDAVPVVRCKDCEHSECNPVKLTYACRHPRGLRGFVNEGYYFCSYGERRTDDG